MGRSVGLLLLTLLLPAATRAHQASIVYTEIVPAGSTLTLSASIKSADLAEALGRAADDAATPAELQRERGSIASYVAQRIVITNDGVRCPSTFGGLTTLEKTDGFFAQVTLRYVCPQALSRVAVHYDLFFDLDPRHQGFGKFVRSGQVLQHIFRRDRRVWQVPQRTSPWSHAADYLVLGIEHIFTGYDHIMFLLGLLVAAVIILRRRQGPAPTPAGTTAAAPPPHPVDPTPPTPAPPGAPGTAPADGPRQALLELRGLRRGLVYTLKIVTAFTIAHSVTLVAAAQGWVRLPTRFVESGIALSIAAIGILNLLGGEGARRSRRWAIAFGFGLVHGFGFASILREVGLPEDALVLSLVSFNVGVELGQAVIVALVFPLLHLLARRTLIGYHRLVMQAGSVLVITCGLYWLLERAWGVALLERLVG